MRGKKILNILKSLDKSALKTVEILDCMPSLYSTSYSKMRDKIRGTDYTERALEKMKEYRKERRNYYNLIHYLKRGGFIEKSRDSWIRTGLGKRKMNELEAKIIAGKSKKYSLERSKTLTIIIFDIPEKERWKRDWLRETLENMGFKKIQQSVWSSKVRLPKEFLEDLKKYEMISYVEIFSVVKEGTLS